jgi:hypothetical protein
VLADLTGKLRTSIRDELLHDPCVREDIADKKVTHLCTGDRFAHRNNVHSLVSSINPDGDGIESFAYREVSDKVCAHDLKRLRRYFIWKEGNDGWMSADFVDLTLGASLYISCNKPLHAGPVVFTFGKLMSSKLSWVSGRREIMIDLYNFLSQLVVVRYVHLSAKDKDSVLVLPIVKSSCNCRVDQLFCRAYCFGGDILT